MRIILAALLLLAAVGYVVSVEHRIQEIRRELNMADVVLTEGVEALNHGTTVKWTSGGKTVRLIVYKATENETRAEFMERLVAAIAAAEAEYPKDLGE